MRTEFVFPVWLGLANLSLSMALLTPPLVTLALRVHQIDPAQQNASLGWVLGLGAFVALIANPVAGRMSDRTTARIGRRRPWLVGGLVVGAAGLAVCATQPSIPGVALGWCLAQAGFNGTLAALTATVADQVLDQRRGVAAAAMGLGQLAGVVAGSMVVGACADHIALQFLLPVVPALLLVTGFAVVLPDRGGPIDRPRAGRILAGLVAGLRRSRDFRWAWLYRFLTALGIATPLSYLAYFLTDRLDIDPEQVAANVSGLVTATFGLTAVAAVLGGWFSDRVGRRKAFLLSGSGLMAVAMTALAVADRFAWVLVAAMVFGIGVGLFMSVGLALVTQVLPDPETAAADLGVANIGTALPQILGPLAAPALLGGGGFAALLAFAALAHMAAAVALTRITGVR
ncbi:MFS transporter [Nocardia sp. CDC159]|uniref:MFS transporter n=1 Tax=Nocardia pulmonis TaxID=2951408 RepID=A0A9X2J1B1_9NOCA|nr:MULTISPECIES: MFS transporter [Nocardia]MCM6776801.1 MFS transporter [Nocardia pulmonis]MCM6789050.1 MFS transporter [Nocardia sp. CDC159]